MKERVVTLMWGTAWDRYGKTFVSSFEKYWPDDVELYIVTDKPLPTDRAVQIPLDTVPGYSSFMEKYSADRKAMGYGCTDRKADPAKRFWKNDAVKWAPQGLAPRAALDGLLSGDVLIWLDADVETIAKPPRHWCNVLLAGADMACLQRDRQHSEIGFWCARIGFITMLAIDRFADMYESGDVFYLPEWHSGYVFDAALAENPTVKIRNLSAGGRGHVWPASLLARYTIHKKGKIKDS
jgi:hypothetical protein